MARSKHSDIGLRAARNTTTAIRKAIDESACPAINSRPNMVENQRGSIDRTQSMP
jgi:hypothetical protein